MGLVCVFGVVVLALHTYITRRFPNIPPAPEPELLLPDALPKPRRRAQAAPYIRGAASSAASSAGGASSAVADSSSSSSLNGAGVGADGEPAMLLLNGAAAAVGVEADVSAAAGALRGPGEASTSSRGAAVQHLPMPCTSPIMHLGPHNCGQYTGVAKQWGTMRFSKKKSRLQPFSSHQSR